VHALYDGEAWAETPMTIAAAHKRAVRALILMALVQVTACSTPPVVLTDPRAVVDAFLAARNRGDAEAALALVDDGAAIRLLRYGSAPAGKEQLRHYLATPGLSFNPIGAPRADGEHVAWLERVEIMGDVLAQDADDPHSVRTLKVGVEAVVTSGHIQSLVETDMKVCAMVC
jgi:hypothetical protein